MQIKPEFHLQDVHTARAIVKAHPFATLVAADLRATHMPCLLDVRADDELAVVGHVARADPFCDALGGPLLAVFQGPHGYVSAGWYEADTISTWNYVIVHLRGTPQVLDDALPVVSRTIDHFEAAVATPWSLDRLSDGGRSMADQVVAFRLVAEWWYAEAKLSQDKPPDERGRVLHGLNADPAYANPALAAAMQELGGV